MNGMRRVTIISDDYFYMNGLHSSLEKRPCLHVSSYHICHNQKKKFNAGFFYKIHKEKGIIILAVDDLNLIREFNAFVSISVIYSLRTFSRNEMVFCYKGVFITNRYLSLKEMIALISTHGKVDCMTDISLTPREEQVLFNYFTLPPGRFKSFRGKFGIKKTSYYKRSAYQKLNVNGDSEAYAVVNALHQINTKHM